MERAGRPLPESNGGTQCSGFPPQGLPLLTKQRILVAARRLCTSTLCHWNTWAITGPPPALRAHRLADMCKAQGGRGAQGARGQRRRRLLPPPPLTDEAAEAEQCWRTWLPGLRRPWAAIQCASWLTGMTWMIQMRRPVRCIALSLSLGLELQLSAHALHSQPCLLAQPGPPCPGEKHLKFCVVSSLPFGPGIGQECDSAAGCSASCSAGSWLRSTRSRGTLLASVSASEPELLHSPIQASWVVNSKNTAKHGLIGFASSSSSSFRDFQLLSTKWGGVIQSHTVPSSTSCCLSIQGRQFTLFGSAMLPCSMNTG